VFKNPTVQSVATEVVVYAAIIGGVYVTSKAYKGMKRKFSRKVA
jgi:hypothetical protein